MIEYDIAYSQGGVRRICTYCFRVLRYKDHQGEGVVHDKCRGTLKRYDAEEADQYTVGAVTYYPRSGLGRVELEDYDRLGPECLSEVIDNIPLLKKVLTYGYKPDDGEFFIRAMAGSHVKIDHTMWALMTVRNLTYLAGSLPAYKKYRDAGYTVMAAFILSLIFQRCEVGPFRRQAAMFIRGWGDYNSFNPATTGKWSFINFIKHDEDYDPWLLPTWNVGGRYRTNELNQGRIGLHLGYQDEQTYSLLNALVVEDDEEFEPFATADDYPVPAGQILPEEIQQAFAEIFEAAGKPLMEQ